MILLALFVYFVFLNSAFYSSYGENQQKSLPNLLFLMSDDLRTDLSIYNRKHIISPNFERLAKRSIIFDKAYNQLAVCFPSRHSMLTGIRPDTTGIHTWTDGQLPFLDSLFSVLVRNNYHSSGIGKLFHHPHNGSNEFPDGRWDGYWYKYQAYEQVFMNSSITPDDNFPEEDFRDYIIASYGIDKIKELVKKSQVTKNPFSISIGFKQPHTQYHIPRKYFELYKNNTYLSNILINAKNDPKYGFPVTTPRMNYRCCDRFKFWPMVDEGRKKSTKILPKFEKFYGSMRFPPQAIMELQWGYFGGITFLDAMLGRVLDTLDELKLWDNTIIVFTSDHGMHVGEKGMWEKYTLFEETTRVPLIIADPRYPQFHGSHYPGIVEVLDILPTIFDLLNINRNPLLCPAGKLCPDFEGKSLAPVIRQGPKVKLDGIDFAISQLRRCPYLRNEGPQSQHPEDKWNAICTRKNKEKGSVMGYSIRNNDWRYTAWFEYSNLIHKPDLSRKLVAEELYSHVGADVSDLDIEFENLIICELDNCVPKSKEYFNIRDKLKNDLYDFLSKNMSYNMREALTKTKIKHNSKKLK